MGKTEAWKEKNLMSLDDVPTGGTVIQKTSYGDLEIQQFTSQCPMTCKNFIQLCLEGYYDDQHLFRLIPGFLAQTGDPTNTGNGGQSVYGKPFKDEFNLRLKFTCRGLVGMASENNIPNSNTSQFFITFTAAESLYKKHTLFGKITGDTIFNLLAMEKVDTMMDDRPINPIKILSTQVQINPFDDIVLRNEEKVYIERPEYLAKKHLRLNPKALNDQSQEQSKQKKKRGANKLNKKLLSFAGDDDESDTSKSEEQEQTKPKTMIALHEKIDSEYISKDTAGLEDDYYKNEIEKRKKNKQNEEDFRKKFNYTISALNSSKNEAKRNNQNNMEIHAGFVEDFDNNSENSSKNQNESQSSSDSQNRKGNIDKDLKAMHKRLKEENLKKIKELAKNDKNILTGDEIKGLKLQRNTKTGKAEIVFDKDSKNSNSRSRSNSSSYRSSTDSEDFENEDQKKIRQKQKDEYEKLKIDYLHFKKDKTGTIDAVGKERKEHDKKLMSMVELKRMKFLTNKKEQLKEKDILGKQNAQSDRMTSEKIVKDKYHWMNTKLKFHVDSANAFNFNEKKQLADERGMNSEFIAMKDAMLNRQFNSAEDDKGRSIELSTEQILNMANFAGKVDDVKDLNKEVYDP